MSELASWLRDPALAPVWAAARDKLERNGVVPRATVTVTGLDRTSRHAVSGLLGHPVLTETLRVNLGALDTQLTRRSGVGGLAAVLDALGGPVRNRAAERSSQAAVREAPYAALRSWLGTHGDVAALPWVEDWLVGVRRSGTLTRSPDPAATLIKALEITEWLVAREQRTPVARTSLAATWTGDAHALDEGEVLAQLVIRALGVASGDSVPATTSGRRLAWERFGVAPDLVSSTCLVLGLRPTGDTGVARRLRLAAEAGDPVHLTGWDLARDPLAFPADASVLVCENPRVLEALAQSPGAAMWTVCTAGMPGLVAMEVLQRLRRSGAWLTYHGDFDWPGIAIANRLLREAGCRPWLMSAADYRAAARRDGLLLSGDPVTPLWDSGLGEAMAEVGVAVHEEAVVDILLAAADCRPPLIC